MSCSDDFLFTLFRWQKNFFVSFSWQADSDLAAVVFPGGFGAAKNLSDFGFSGTDMNVNPEVGRVIREFHAAGKPIALCCIAPILAAKVLGSNGDKINDNWRPVFYFLRFYFFRRRNYHGSAGRRIRLAVRGRLERCRTFRCQDQRDGRSRGVHGCQEQNCDQPRVHVQRTVPWDPGRRDQDDQGAYGHGSKEVKRIAKEEKSRWSKYKPEFFKNMDFIVITM